MREDASRGEASQSRESNAPRLARVECAAHFPTSMPTALPIRRAARAAALAIALVSIAPFADPLGAPLGAPLRAQDPVPVDSTVAKQLDLGAQWFRASCVECHATSLADPDFRLKWSGRTAYDLFETIRSTMPEHDPGSLTLGTYASIVAYLMKLNGMPVGTTALSSDSTALAAVRLTFAPAASAASTPR